LEAELKPLKTYKRLKYRYPAGVPRQRYSVLVERNRWRKPALRGGRYPALPNGGHGADLGPRARRGEASRRKRRVCNSGEMAWPPRKFSSSAPGGRANVTAAGRRLLCSPTTRPVRWNRAAIKRCHRDGTELQFRPGHANCHVVRSAPLLVAQSDLEVLIGANGSATGAPLQVARPDSPGKFRRDCLLVTRGQ